MKRRRLPMIDDGAEGCEAVQYDLFGDPTRIMAPARPPAPRTPAGCDPFRIDGPACVSFSGGLTSAYMLRRILDAHGGRLPRDVYALFENTGKERPETLDFVRDCAVAWGVAVRWIERDPDAEHGYREVEYETASRRGEPFDQLIADKKFLPNRSARFCTQELKIEVMRGFMRAEGYDHWTNVVGLRRDEVRRVIDIRAQEPDQWDVAVPLYDAGVRKPDVVAFWNEQPFRLALESWEGNCDLCFLKGLKKRERIMRDRPDLVAWWADAEARVGGRFHSAEPGYAVTLERVEQMLALAPREDVDDDATDDSVSCLCTQRRGPKRCDCGAARGEGHALACRMVFDPKRAA